jgi:hypothetical protein
MSTTERITIVPAAPSWWAKFTTCDGTTRLRVVAWQYDGTYGWTVVEQPSRDDHCPAIVAALELCNELGWSYVGTWHEEDQ